MKATETTISVACPGCRGELREQAVAGEGGNFSCDSCGMSYGACDSCGGVRVYSWADDAERCRECEAPTYTDPEDGPPANVEGVTALAWQAIGARYDELIDLGVEGYDEISLEIDYEKLPTEAPSTTPSRYLESEGMLRTRFGEFAIKISIERG